MGSTQSTPTPFAVPADAAPDIFLCPISHELMQDPVICCDGHSYERENIAQWIDQQPTSGVLSPMTGAPLANVRLTENIALRQAIHEFTQGLLLASEALSDHAARMLLGLGEHPRRDEVRTAFHEQAAKLTLAQAPAFRRLCDAYLRLTGSRPLVADTSGLCYVLLTEAVMAEKERLGVPSAPGGSGAKQVLAFSPRSGLDARLSLGLGMQAQLTPASLAGLTAETSVPCGLYESYRAFEACGAGSAMGSTLSCFLVTAAGYADVESALLLGQGLEALCCDGPRGHGLQLHLRPFDAFAFAETEQQRDRYNRRVLMLNVARAQAGLLQPLDQPGVADGGLVETVVGPRQPNLLLPAGAIPAAQLTPVWHVEPDTAGWRQLRRLTHGTGVDLPIAEAFLLFFQAVNRRE